jgi:hypothetical protein
MKTTEEGKKYRRRKVIHNEGRKEIEKNVPA